MFQTSTQLLLASLYACNGLILCREAAVAAVTCFLHGVVNCTANGHQYGAASLLLCFVSLANNAWWPGQEAGVRELPGRFDDTDVELMRYAGTAGLLRAPPGGRPAVAARSARSVQATMEWLADHRFLTDGELQQWDHLVRGSTSPGMFPDDWRPGYASEAA